MDIFKIIAVGLITVVAAILLKQIKPELSIFVIIAGSIVMILLILNSAGIVFDNFKTLIDKTGLNNNIFTAVLKVIGVGYLVDFAGGICTDAGVQSVAEKIFLAGKLLILIMCMPVINSLIQVVLKLVP